MNYYNLSHKISESDCALKQHYRPKFCICKSRTAAVRSHIKSD